VAPPFRRAEFDIMYGQGISRAGSLLDVGLEMDMVTKSGAFLSYGETRLGQGRENARTFLEENAEVADEMEAEIRRRAGLTGRPAKTESDDEEETGS